MSNEEFLCARCARHMKTCCQTSEVYATQGDVQRIRQFTGKQDFTEYRIPENRDYSDQSHDPAWAQLFREDGSRRILKRQPNGDCFFLGTAGCCLPLQTRPLICRLYPFDYTEQGLTEDLAPGCPLELLRPGSGLIDELEMSENDARQWHKQLYEEIRMESEHE
jgi:Fe-S-cluster containining protein